MRALKTLGRLRGGRGMPPGKHLIMGPEEAPFLHLGLDSTSQAFQNPNKLNYYSFPQNVDLQSLGIWGRPSQTPTLLGACYLESKGNRQVLF